MLGSPISGLREKRDGGDKRASGRSGVEVGLWAMVLMENGCSQKTDVKWKGGGRRKRVGASQLEMDGERLTVTKVAGSGVAWGLGCCLAGHAALACCGRRQTERQGGAADDGRAGEKYRVTVSGIVIPPLACGLPCLMTSWRGEAATRHKMYRNYSGIVRQPWQRLGGLITQVVWEPWLTVSSNCDSRFRGFHYHTASNSQPICAELSTQSACPTCPPHLIVDPVTCRTGSRAHIIL